MKEEKRYFLVDISDVFVDAHRELDYASGSSKSISNDVKLLEFDGKYASGDGICKEEELYGSEDGYNSKYEFYSVNEITREQAEEAQKIIDAYKEL